MFIDPDNPLAAEILQEAGGGLFFGLQKHSAELIAQ